MSDWNFGTFFIWQPNIFTVRVLGFGVFHSSYF